MIWAGARNVPGSDPRDTSEISRLVSGSMSHRSVLHSTIATNSRERLWFNGVTVNQLDAERFQRTRTTDTVRHWNTTNRSRSKSFVLSLNERQSRGNNATSTQLLWLRTVPPSSKIDSQNPTHPDKIQQQSWLIFKYVVPLKEIQTCIMSYGLIIYQERTQNW